MAETFTVTQFCPRCDDAFVGVANTDEKATAAARKLVRDHLKIQIDELHDSALEQWDDDGV